MRRAYLGGATGALASGIIWCLAGAVGLYASSVASMMTLFIGGMFIFPLAIVFSKLLGSTGKHSSDNMLGKLAIEGLGILFGGLFIAFVIAQLNSALFYPVMLIIIGARYLTFQTLYGLNVYWALGGMLMLSGFILTLLAVPFIVGAFAGGAIEVIFALILYQQNRKMMSGVHAGL